MLREAVGTTRAVKDFGHRLGAAYAWTACTERARRTEEDEAALEARQFKRAVTGGTHVEWNAEACVGRASWLPQRDSLPGGRQDDGR